MPYIKNCINHYFSDNCVQIIHIINPVVIFNEKLDFKRKYWIFSIDRQFWT